MELLVNATKEQVELARSLGHKEIVILSGARSAHPPSHSRARGEGEGMGKGVKKAVLVTSVNQAKALKQKFDYIIAPCRREFFESKFVDFILEPEDQNRGDFIHHRNSGLNQVLLKLCQATPKRPGKSIIASSSLLLNAKHPEVVLGRMFQNARWCRKYKVDYLITSGARTKWEQRDKACLDALRLELHKS